MMEKHYVGSEIGQLRSVMLHRPNLSLKGWRHQIAVNCFWWCSFGRTCRRRAWHFRQHVTSARDWGSVTHWFIDTNLRCPRCQRLVAGDTNLWLSPWPRFRHGYSCTACRYAASGTRPAFKRWANLRRNSCLNQKIWWSILTILMTLLWSHYQTTYLPATPHAGYITVCQLTQWQNRAAKRNQ